MIYETVSYWVGLAVFVVGVGGVSGFVWRLWMEDRESRRKARLVSCWRLVVSGDRPDSRKKVGAQVAGELRTFRWLRRGSGRFDISRVRWHDPATGVVDEFLVVAGHPAAEQVANQLASVLGVTLVPCDVLELESDRVRVARTGLFVGCDLGATGPLEGAADLWAGLLEGSPGGWVAVTLRPVSVGWRKHVLQLWYRPRLREADMDKKSHPMFWDGLARGVVAARFDDESLAGRAVCEWAGSTPLWDLSVEPGRVVAGKRVNVLVGFAGWVVGLVALRFFPGMIGLGVGVVSVFGALGAMVVVGLGDPVVRPAERCWGRALASGRVFVPRRHPWRSKLNRFNRYRSRQKALAVLKSKSEGGGSGGSGAKATVRRDVEEGRYDKASMWPDYTWVVPVNEPVMASLMVVATPGVSSASSQRVVTQRNASAACRSAVGPTLGFDPSGARVGLSETDAYGGMFAVGDPGSGKSTLLINVWGWKASIRLRGLGSSRRSPYTTHPAWVEGTPGLLGMIWLDTKGDDISRVVNVLRRGGYTDKDFVVVDVTGNQKGCPRLELMPRGDERDPGQVARTFTDALSYSLRAGAFEDQARALFSTALELALSIPDDMWVTLNGPGVRFHPIRFVETLLDTSEPDRLREVWAFLKQEADLRRGGVSVDGSNPFGAEASNVPLMMRTAAGDPFVRAVDRWNYYASKPAKDLEFLARSTMNKLNQLSHLEGLWAGFENQETVTLDELVMHHKVVVMCFASMGATRETPVVAQRLAAMTSHLLNETIKTRCGNWQEAGRAVAIFSDECDMVAGIGREDVTDIIGDLHNKGRAFGVQLFLATQRYQNLPLFVQAVCRSMAVNVQLATSDTTAATSTVEMLTARGDLFTVQDVASLGRDAAGRCVGVVASRVNNSQQPAYTLSVPWDSEFDVSLPAVNDANVLMLGTGTAPGPV